MVSRSISSAHAAGSLSAYPGGLDGGCRALVLGDALKLNAKFRSSAPTALALAWEFLTHPGVHRHTLYWTHL